jgi:hypothetical protein
MVAKTQAIKEKEKVKMFARLSQLSPAFQV